MTSYKPIFYVESVSTIKKGCTQKLGLKIMKFGRMADKFTKTNFFKDHFKNLISHPFSIFFQFSFYFCHLDKGFTIAWNFFNLTLLSVFKLMGGQTLPPCGIQGMRGLWEIGLSSCQYFFNIKPFINPFSQGGGAHWALEHREVILKS